MKKIYGFLGAAALMSLASCSNDGMDSPSNPSTPGKGDYAYAQVRIQMGNMTGTRAEDESSDNIENENQDFAVGTEAESKVNDVLLIFYNNNGIVVGTGSFDPEKQGNSSTNSPMVSNVVEVAIELKDNADPIDATQVVAYVNFTSDMKDMITNAPLNEAQTIAFDLEDFDFSSMPMTNSGYYPNGTGNYTIATDCTGCVYQLNSDGSMPENIKVTPVDIYVDRIPAKVELVSVGGIESQTVYQTDGNEVTMNFTPTFWGVSGTAQTTYALKNMPSSVDGWMKDGYSNMRNYWAASPFYAGSISVPSNPSPSATDEFTFGYIKQNEAAKNITVAPDNRGTYNVEASQYVLENTLPATIISAQTLPVAAVSSVVLVGNWSATINGAESVKYADGFFLRKNNIDDKTYIYTEDEAIAMLVAIAAQNIATDADGTPLTSGDVDFVTIPGKASNYNYIQINNDAREKTYYKNTSGQWVAFDGIDEVDNYLSTYVGSVASYYLGNASFIVPLKHYFTTGYSTENSIPENLETGNFGLVRNNWYQLTINSITSFGAGFGQNENGEDIIIPNPEDEDQMFGLTATLNVLQWHMRSQSVDL